MLVEGEDDKYFWANIINRTSIQIYRFLFVLVRDIQMYSKPFLLKLRFQDAKFSEFILDANDDLMKRWLDIHQALNSVVDTNVPKIPKSGGTIIELSKRYFRI